MKFKDIKVGDTVFVQKPVNYGYRMNKYFFVQTKVVRVTATQFTTGNGFRFKKDGRQIGEYTRAYLEGDVVNTGTTKTVIDQTLEMESFKQKLSLKMQIRNIIGGLDLDKNTTKSLDELNEILALVEQLETKLK